jgi:hypothetical protein
MSSEDDSFIADGPAEFAFRCNGANIGVGGVMSGWWIGLYAQGLDFGIQIPEQFLFGRAGVIGDVKNGGGVVGLSDNLYGVYGQVGDTDLGGTPAGVCGVSQSNAGVSGRSSEWVGVFGQADTNIGVFGMSRDSWGVFALSGTAASQPMEHAALLATSAERAAKRLAVDPGGNLRRGRVHSGRCERKPVNAIVCRGVAGDTVRLDGCAMNRVELQ